MVKVAVAGGTGNVATELLRAPIASGEHDFTIFSRSTPAKTTPGLRYRVVDYGSVDALAEELRGFDICLSFLVVMQQDGFQAQINLIDACVVAGVKRFAPSEWAIKNYNDIPAYRNKDRTIEYLKEMNKEKEVLQYCAFQPSVFMDYFAHPHPLSPNLHTWPFPIDLSTRHAILFTDPTLNAHPLVLTRITDVSTLLALALSTPLSTPWPQTGGLRGARTSLAEIFALGRKIRGGEWVVEEVEAGDLEGGVLTSGWVPVVSHPAVGDEVREAFSRDFVVGFLRAVVRGAWDVGEEWNRRFPGLEVMGLEAYLREAWEGRE